MWLIAAAGSGRFPARNFPQTGMAAFHPPADDQRQDHLQKLPQGGGEEIWLRAAAGRVCSLARNIGLRLDVRSDAFALWAGPSGTEGVNHLASL